MDIQPEDTALREAQARRARLRLGLALAAIASTAVLTAIGTWTYLAVERSLRELRTQTLKAALDAQAKTVDVWIEDQKFAIRRLARDRLVREHVAQLAAIATRAGAAPEQYCAAPTRRPLVAQLDDALAGSGAVAFHVIGRSGLILASKFREYCGLRVAPVVREQSLEPVFQGETLFVPPSSDAERLERAGAGLPLARPVVWIETPVTDNAGNVIAALGVGQFADEQFGAIVSAARAGRTGESYAFDRRGMMLSESRFKGTLADAGRVAPGTGTTLSLVLAPPGAPSGTLTRLAASAQAGIGAGEHEGQLLSPYTGYYGGEVIGAWRWLAAHRLAIAVEVGSDEAYAPLLVLRTVFAVVFGALLVAVLVALYAWFAAAKLRIGEPRRLGPYVLGERIGEGGHANVYLATHDLLKRPTAIKLLKPIKATDEITARFQREVQLASRLSHPNMVEIFDYGRAAGGVLYYAMEYLEGTTVNDLVQRGGALPVARAVHLVRQVCAGLAEAHGKGMVHRDISATNIMVCHYGGEYDFAKILDFGLVKRVSEPDSHTITRTLRILGTPLYMAPERLRDPADVDARADIYAVGAVAFFMITGRKVFDATDELALTTKILNEPAPRAAALAGQGVPPALDALIAACLEKRREDRPQRIAELQEVLERLSRELPWTQADAQAAWTGGRAAVGAAA
ncbi:MAG TPA: serine/threonine protein kinase [Burkholderiales bacterium]|nr:serine/threonine protein kinase [Burkholderiales bacterium]